MPSVRATPTRCQIKAGRVDPLLQRLGLPSRRQNALVCGDLGVALQHALASTRGRAIRVPTVVVGEGVAGLVFRLRDGSIIKVIALDDTEAFMDSSEAVPKAEFDYEVLATRNAHKVLKGHGVRVPEVFSHSILRVPEGRIGVQHMQFLQGKTMAQLLARAGPDVTRTLIRRWARAQATVHNRGLVHCDLHASNIMMDRNGHVAILDWARSHRRTWFQARDDLDTWCRLVNYDLAFSAFDIRRTGNAHLVPYFLEEYKRRARHDCPIDYRRIANNARAYKTGLDLMFSTLDTVAADPSVSFRRKPAARRRRKTARKATAARKAGGKATAAARRKTGSKATAAARRA